MVALPTPLLTAELSYYGLSERDGSTRATRDRTLHTLVVHAFRAGVPNRFGFEVEFAEQFGSISASDRAGAARLDVSARFLHAEASYQWAAAWRPRAILAFDYATGDRRDGGFGRFDTLFGMRRADFAPSGIYGAIGRTNIVSPVGKIEITPDRSTDAFIGYRSLWLAARTDAFSTTGVRDAAGGSGRFAGHQFEGRVRHWIVKDRLRAEANMLYLAKGRFLRTAPNTASRDDTRYVALALSTFF